MFKGSDTPPQPRVTGWIPGAPLEFPPRKLQKTHTHTWHKSHDIGSISDLQLRAWSLNSLNHQNWSFRLSIARHPIFHIPQSQSPELEVYFLSTFSSSNWGMSRLATHQISRVRHVKKINQACLCSFLIRFDTREISGVKRWRTPWTDFPGIIACLRWLVL